MCCKVPSHSPLALISVFHSFIYSSTFYSSHFLPSCIRLYVYMSICLSVCYHAYYLLLLLPFHAMPCILHSFLLASVFIKLCPICAERTGGSFKGGTDICSPLIRGSELVGDNIEWAGADLLMVTGNLIPSLFFIITFFYYSMTPSSSIFPFSSRASLFLSCYTRDHNSNFICNRSMYMRFKYALE